MTVVITGPGPRTVVVQGTAGANLSGHRVVRPDGAGAVVYADPTDSATWKAGPWWLTQRAIALGASDDLLAVGELTEPSWAWTPGARLFLSTAGLLSTVPPPDPTRMVQVAVARSSDTIWFDPQMPIETT
jgi:hypothetical protein